jgi:hypothetical protein
VALAVALVTMVAAQWSVTFPLYVHNGLGISYSLLGFGLALNGLIVVFGQTWTTQSVLGRRHTTIGIAGTALYALAFLGLGETGDYNGLFQAIGGAAALLAILLGGIVLTYVSNSLEIWVILTAPALPAIPQLRHAAGRIPAFANLA